MYAVVRTGGRQFRVAQGESVRVEKLPGAVGDTIELAEVLLVGSDGEPRVGAPVLAGAKVVGTIVAQGKGAKLTMFKMRRRKGYRRKYGHRQLYTEIRVDRIEG
ncbi:MAG TPA: 50S ribosomal protein L21 [Myxococcota bacterium]|jgi:large subunit ribosomal protein L21